jgi:hypothetical protein
MTSDSDSAAHTPHDGNESMGEPRLLKTVYDPVEAEIIIAKLRSAGIEAYASHDALSVIYGLTLDGFGQRDIFVCAEDFDEALAALETDPDQSDPDS